MKNWMSVGLLFLSSYLWAQNGQVNRVPAGSGVASINGVKGPFTFSGSGVTCTSTTCTFSGTGSGVSSFNTRTGPVTPALNDYNFNQLAGTATLAQIGGLGTNVATFLTTPTSANFAAAITNETGSGFVVFSASPALTGTPDASGATQFKLPVAAAYASIANGEQGYDTTNKNWHAWANAVDNIEALFPASTTITNNDCVKWLNTASVITLADAGAACGSGGGAPAFPVTVTGGVSGAVPYFSSATVESVSAAGLVNALMKWGGAGNPPVASSIVDNGTTVVTAEALTASSLTTTVSGGAGGFYSQPEGTVVTTASGFDTCYGDSTDHSQKCSYNNGSFFDTPQQIAHGATALATGSITSGSCVTSSPTATGTVSTDSIEWNPNASIKAVTGYVPATTGGLSIAAYPTANTVNFDICNWTSGSITPGAVTLNWRVIR